MAEAGGTIELRRVVSDEDGVWIGDFDEWRRQELPEHALRDCSFAAVAGREVVGYATLHDAGAESDCTR